MRRILLVLLVAPLLALAGSITVFCGVASRGVVGPKAAIELGQKMRSSRCEPWIVRLAGRRQASGAVPASEDHVGAEHAAPCEPRA